MTNPRIYAFICVLLLSSLCGYAQQVGSSGDSQSTDSVQQFRGIQVERMTTPTYSEQPLFCGISVGVDLAGAIMAQFAKFGQYEAQARLNFKQRYFVAFEAGVGTSNYTHAQTEQHFNVHAPYFRIGGDYNFHNNPVSGNRIYAGVRYGFSKFKYDVSGPSIADPVWGNTFPYSYTGIDGCQHWGELVAGLEGRLWRFIHAGWTVRWKFRFKQRESDFGTPFFVPGYGNNSDGSCFGGTFTLLFDISDIKNSKRTK